MEESFQSKYEKSESQDESEFTIFDSKGSDFSSVENIKPPTDCEKFNYIPGLNEPGINCGE
jgi:hypothetical protein